MSTVAEIKAGRSNVRTLKGVYTAFVGQLVAKVNAGQAVTMADWNALVTGNYDPVTLAMNDLGANIDALPDFLASGVGQAAIPPVGKILDGNGDTWGFGANKGGSDFEITRNNVPFFGYVGCFVAIDAAGKVWMRDDQANWWTRDATGKFVTSMMTPWGVNPLNVRSWNTHDGATIVGGSTAKAAAGQAFVVDMNAVKWSMGAQATNGKDYIVMRNDLPFTEPGFTSKPYEALQITLKNGTPWMKNAAGSWVYPS